MLLCIRSWKDSLTDALPCLFFLCMAALYACFLLCYTFVWHGGFFSGIRSLDDALYIQDENRKMKRESWEWIWI